MSNRIRDARRDRGWSQTRMIAELQRIAARRNIELPGLETMKSRVSRWENNHSRPDDFYRELLREALGMDDHELGFAPGRDEQSFSAADELRARLTTRSLPDKELIQSLAAQTEAIRRQDREYGAGSLLEQMRAHVLNIEGHLLHAVFDSVRQPLAVVLADAASLAGWQAFDLGSLDQAWRFFETAARAAQQAGDHELYAFSRMEQVQALGQLADPATAARVAESLWRSDAADVSPAVRCWMAAATAEMLADSGDAKAALRMVGEAESLANSLESQRPPYLVFNDVHLDRWIGHTLTVVNDPAAEARLRRADEQMDSTFTRAATSLSIDLAAALFNRGERDEAKEFLAKAEQLAKRIGSRRQMARIDKLRGA
ncbi:MAG TPA: helix-turn-helix transcriptional regulator [Nocardioidaceae bacterium]|nr:helix-turn-helix transcriptional regulator [Nocardioidaceae bacterium]